MIKGIKERLECKENQESLVILVCLEKLEKEDQPVYLEKEDYQVIKEYVETKEIKAKLDHLVIKGKEVIKVRKECLVVLEALVSLVKKD